MAIPRVTVLISGRGSNLAALLAADRAGALSGTISSVISNRADAAGLEVAGRFGVASAVIESHRFSNAAFDKLLADAVDASEPDLVVLAGFMRILGQPFVARYAGRMLNIHPSLLPAYTGLHTHRRALADGVRIHGCTVHFVTPELDRGPIVAQAAVLVRDDDDPVTLAARVLAAEHRLLPKAVDAFCDGRMSVTEGRVRIADSLEPFESSMVSSCL